MNTHASPSQHPTRRTVAEVLLAEVAAAEHELKAALDAGADTEPALRELRRADAAYAAWARAGLS